MKKVLFRESLEEEGEYKICSSLISTVKYRSEIPENTTVIGRYSVLPFYKELEDELLLKNSKLVNSHKQHLYIADVFNWANEYNGALSKLTPRTWDTWHSLPQGSFVVKGRTNSRKNSWQTHMFAKTKDDVSKIAMRLLDDTFISQQGIVVREYIPLRKLDEGLNGLPISNEWRTFWYVDEDKNVHMIAKGFYWATFDEAKKNSEWTIEAESLSWDAAEAIKDQCSFFVLDLAQTESGSWIVIEVNDGQMSGLSGLDHHEFYKELSKI